MKNSDNININHILKLNNLNFTLFKFIYFDIQNYKYNYINQKILHIRLLMFNKYNKYN